MFLNTDDRLFPLKVGDELFLDSLEHEADEKLEFRFELAFGEPGVIDGAGLLETLTELVKLTADLIERFASFV